MVARWFNILLFPDELYDLQHAKRDEITIQNKVCLSVDIAVLLLI